MKQEENKLDPVKNSYIENIKSLINYYYYFDRCLHMQLVDIMPVVFYTTLLIMKNINVLNTILYQLMY